MPVTRQKVVSCMYRKIYKASISSYFDLANIHSGSGCRKSVLLFTFVVGTESDSSISPGGCKTYLTCGAHDPLSSPPFLPLRLVSQMRSLVSDPTAIKGIGRTGRSFFSPKCLIGRRKIPWLEIWDSEDALVLQNSTASGCKVQTLSAA